MENFSYFSIFIVSILLISKFLALKFKKGLFPIIGDISLLSSNGVFFVFLLNRWINAGYFPISNLFESLIFLSCILLLLSLAIEKKTKSQLISAITSPIIWGLTFFAHFILPKALQEASPLVPSLQSDWLMFHVSTMILSYATLIIGSLISILYLIISWISKKEKLKFNYSKSVILENLDNFSYQIIGVGFPLLTLGIIAGAVWANEAWGNYWSWDPKETWALITWLIFAIYLHARIIKKWKKEKAALIATIGFFVIWLCYLGVNFLAKGLHSYGFLS